jgi:Zn-dependent protease with chaperone function
MTALAFFAALASVGLGAAWLTSALTRLLHTLLPAALHARLLQLPPHARTELAAGLVLLPILLGASSMIAAGFPSLLYAIGWGVDHCPEHTHHLHFCYWHASMVSPLILGVSAGGYLLTFAHLARLTRELLRVEVLAKALQRVSQPRAGFWLVPSAFPLCHTVGTFRPRVFISEGVLTSLNAEEGQAALAHETAHLHRADPRWGALLTLCDRIGRPIDLRAPTRPGPDAAAGPWLQLWREAAEEAADDHAAALTDGPTVARALLAIARLRLHPPDLTPLQPSSPQGPFSGFAFGEGALERRVHRLLQNLPTGPNRAPDGRRPGTTAIFLGLFLVFGAVVANDPLHHAIEAAWAHTLGHPALP